MSKTNTILHHSFAPQPNGTCLMHMHLTVRPEQGPLAQMAPAELPVLNIGTQVWVRGDAYVPQGNWAHELVAEVHGEGLHGSVLCHGSRTWMRQLGRWKLQDPELMHSIPVNLVFALGGGSKDLLYPPNPFGMGFGLRKHTDRTTPPPAYPQLQSLHQKVPVWCGQCPRWDSWNTLPAPAHLGYVPQKVNSRSGNLATLACHPSLYSSTSIPANSTLMFKNLHPSQPKVVVEIPGQQPIAWFVADNVAKSAPMYLSAVDAMPSINGALFVYHCAFSLPTMEWVRKVKKWSIGQRWSQSQ